MSLFNMFNKSYDFYDNIFNVIDYRKYVIKRHIDIPKYDQKGQAIILIEDPTYLPEYKNYPYLITTAPCLKTGYCVGYNVDTIPDRDGRTEKFMPIYSHLTGKERIHMNLQFKEKYKKYLKRIEIKRMWNILFTLMSVKIPAKIKFCHEVVETDSCIPIEIAHIIYEFLRD